MVRPNSGRRSGQILDHRALSGLLHRIAEEYPPSLRVAQHADVPRMAFNISRILAARPTTVCDLGGGIGLFSVGCAALGIESWLVDDFSDPVNIRFGDAPLKVHRRYGVRLKSADMLHEDMGFRAGQFDAVTSFDSIEHWHNSPRQLLRRVAVWLAPGGQFLLGAPNCVNILKRVTVPLGRGKWSPFEEWYELDEFRGHVREPDVDDLRSIAADMALERVSVFGRNWLGYRSKNRLVRLLVPIMDRPMQNFPSLCADIYVHGFKPLPKNETRDSPLPEVRDVQHLRAS